MSFLTRLSRFVITHKRWVALFWVVVTLAGMITVGTTVNRLSTTFSVPGKEGPQASAKIAAIYGISNFDNNLVTVVQLPQGTTVDTEGVVPQLAAFDQQVMQTDPLPSGQPSLKVVSYASTCAAGACNRHFVSGDGRTTFSVVTIPNPPPNAANAFDVPQQEKDLRKFVNTATVAGGTVRLTGLDELVSNTPSSEGPSLLIETLVAGVGALAILAFVFASFIAFVPIIIAVVAIMTSFLLILGLTYVTDVSFIVQFLVGLIGLGVAIDYSLLIVTRWREERARGLSNDDAIATAMEKAGRAVIFSGTTVGIGLLALVVLPVPFLRSVGYGGLLIPMVSVIVSVTLLPVILHSVGGEGVRWPWQHLANAASVLFFIPRFLRRVATYPNIRKEAHVSRGWAAWGRLVVRERWLAAGAAIALIAVLMVPAAQLTVGTPVPDSLAHSGPAYEGLKMLESSGLGTGSMEPNWVLITARAPAPSSATVSAVVAAAQAVPNMVTALAPQGPGWSPPPGVSTSLVMALSNLNPDTSEGRGQITLLRTAVHRGVGGTGAIAELGGAPAGSADFVDAVYGSFPLMLTLVLIITFILLARAFRSLLLALKAVLLNVASVLAAYGIMVFVWQQGHGSSQLFGINATGAVAEWIPIFVFAFLFGLSMDYEVFILSRIREEYDATGNTDLAVVRALGRTGRLVTSAALILFLAFLILGSAPGTIIKTFATALAAGIFFDATVIRMLLVPALVSLFGRWNWWLPHVPAALLRTRPSEPTHERRMPVQPQEV